MYLVKGVFILLICYLISGWANLVTVHWILDKTWSVIILAVAIIFQPELRNALEKLGRGGMRLKAGNPLNEAQLHYLGEVKKFLQVASSTKTGALIVLEGEITLKEQIETGIPLDAKISYELLMNIFKDKAPLHDGAVIIRGLRIIAASCILPLSNNSEIDSSYGTRHRAALGISEVSNALIIVVSEETGKISIVHNGHIMTCSEEADIDTALDNFYYREKIPVYRRFFPKWRRRNG